MRVIGPDHQWIADDELLALIHVLRELEQDLTRLGEQLGRSEQWASLGADGRPRYHSWPEVSAKRRAIEAIAHDIDRVQRSIERYIHDTAAQERWRINALEGTRDWIVAVTALTFGHTSTPHALGDVGIADAARALLPPDWSPRLPTVTFAYSATGLDAPQGIAERVDRIPSGEEPPIRIERFQSGGEWLTEVYIAGTRDLTVGTSSEVFDMESNLALVAGLSATSLIAVQVAMAKAGVTPGDKVTFVGHSQGGLIAARLAQSGTYTTTGLLTVGAPLGTAPIKGDFPAIALAHTDDPVPALGGAAAPSRILRVEAPSDAMPGDIDGQHSLSSYVKTARQVDSSPAAKHLNTLPEVTGKGTATGYRAERD